MKARFEVRALASLAFIVPALVLAACGAEEPTAVPPTSPPPTVAPTPTQASRATSPTPIVQQAAPQPTATSAPAQPAFDAAAHFKGKTIRLMVGFRPGGGTDLQARYFAANWPKFIPGNPKMVVTNLTPNPADRNFVWKSKPDGTTLSFLASAGVGTEFTDPTAEFVSAEFTQIGSHAKRDVVWLVRGETVPYQTLKDAKGGDVVLTIADQLGRAEDLGGKILASGLLSMWLEAPFKYISVATEGSADDLLMIERGDVNGYIAGSHWYSLPTLRPGWFKDGFVRPIADMSHPGAPAIPNSEISMPVPNVVEWMTPEQREIWDGLILPDVLSGKGVAGPPKMAPEVAKALRDAYVAAMKDPGFSAGLEKIQGQPIGLVDGATMQQLVQEATAAFEKQLPRYEEIRSQVFDRFAK